MIHLKPCSPKIASFSRGDCQWNSGSLPAIRLMNPDFVDLLRALRDADVRHLIVGVSALAHHGVRVQPATSTGGSDLRRKVSEPRREPIAARIAWPGEGMRAA